jgi:hypothetical protein
MTFKRTLLYGLTFLVGNFVGNMMTLTYAELWVKNGNSLFSLFIPALLFGLITVFVTFYFWQGSWRLLISNMVWILSAVATGSSAGIAIGKFVVYYFF